MNFKIQIKFASYMNRLVVPKCCRKHLVETILSNAVHEALKQSTRIKLTSRFN